jgi:hypothetical protein
MKIDVNDPISTIKPELTEIQEMVIRDDMSHTDVVNWLFDFCTRIGCGVTDTDEEIKERARQEKSRELLNKQALEQAKKLEDDKPYQEAQSGQPQNLPDGFVMGYGNTKGDMCCQCFRVFTTGEIYADKGKSSLCAVHAYQKGIIKLTPIQYEKVKRQQGVE